MIDAKELRIGNWVRSIHTGNVQVSLFMLGEIADDETYLDHLMPIPLSPEVLDRIEGFVKLEGSKRFWWKFDGVGAVDVKKLGDVYRYKEGHCVYFFKDGKAFCSVGLSITSLHQLQNLYHSLTSKEIEYRP